MSNTRVTKSISIKTKRLVEQYLRELERANSINIASVLKGIILKFYNPHDPFWKALNIYSEWLFSRNKRFATLEKKDPLSAYHSLIGGNNIKEGVCQWKVKVLLTNHGNPYMHLGVIALRKNGPEKSKIGYPMIKRMNNYYFVNNMGNGYSKIAKKLHIIGKDNGFVIDKFRNGDIITIQLNIHKKIVKFIVKNSTASLPIRSNSYGYCIFAGLFNEGDSISIQDFEWLG